MTSEEDDERMMVIRSHLAQLFLRHGAISQIERMDDILGAYEGQLVELDNDIRDRYGEGIFPNANSREPECPNCHSKKSLLTYIADKEEMRTSMERYNEREMARLELEEERRVRHAASSSSPQRGTSRLQLKHNIEGSTTLWSGGAGGGMNLEDRVQKKKRDLKFSSPATAKRDILNLMKQ